MKTRTRAHILYEFLMTRSDIFTDCQVTREKERERERECKNEDTQTHKRSDLTDDTQGERN